MALGCTGAVNTPSIVIAIAPALFDMLHSLDASYFADKKRLCDERQGARWLNQEQACGDN
jgi:hypothetical protein